MPSAAAGAAGTRKCACENEGGAEGGSHGGLLERRAPEPTAARPRRHSRKASAASHGCSAFNASRWSARVRPRLIAADRFAGARRRLDEAEARIDHQRRADDQHRVGVFEMAHRRLDARSRGTFSPKNTTSGLSTPPQCGQVGTTKVEKSTPSRSASPSGASAASSASQSGIQPFELLLQFVARRHARRSPCSGRGRAARAGRSPPRCRRPDAVGRRSGSAGSRSCPSPRAAPARDGRRSAGRGRCAASRSGCAPNSAGASPPAPMKAWIGDRRRALPGAVGVAIVGNARVHAASGAGQNEEAPMPVDEVS